jgi:zinc transport system substrate-binding protein
VPRLPLLLTTLVVGALVLTGCRDAGSVGSLASDDGRPSVVAAFYPLAYAAQQVGGDAVHVTSLTPPGVEPHDLELSATQVADIAAADVVLYVKGFQPAVDEAVQQQAADRAIDVSAGLNLLSGDTTDGSGGATDPHIWLDPANMAAIGDAVAARIAELVPASADGVERDRQAFSDSMTALAGRFRDGLRTCASRSLVVSHEAFGYLAKAFGLTQVGISGLSPEAEPSPARLKSVAELVRAQGVTTIYYETLVDPKVAQTVADETGARTAVLDPLEGLVDGSTGDYVSIMNTNLATLVAGQGCT